MAEKIVVKAEKRDGRGTNFARRIRREGKVPVTVYGGGEDAVSATAELKDLAAIIRSDSGVNTLFTLDIDGVGDNRVIFQDRQIHPVTGRLLHADLRRLAKGEKIELTIAINLIGEPIGVRDEGGILEQQMREITVKCTPSNIPESIDVNVEDLALNGSITIADISVEDEVEMMDSPESVVAAVVFLKQEVDETEVADEDSQPKIVGQEDSSKEGGE